MVLVNVCRTGMMCRHAYNGNCNLRCRHSIPHKREEECKRYCRRANERTVCIEVIFAGPNMQTTTSYGKLITSDSENIN